MSAVPSAGSNSAPSSQSVQMRSPNAKWLGWAILAVGLIILPWVAPAFWVYFAAIVGINIVASHGLNIMMGYTGLLSLGHAAFMGVGAYTAALAQIHLGLPFFIAIPLAGLVAAIVGVGFGLPSLRIRGLYIVIATLSAQFILLFVFVQWQSVTNGDVGLNVEPANLFGFAINSLMRNYYFILIVATLMTIFAINVINSRVGRAFVAVREKDLTAGVLGVEIVWYKLVAFGLGSFYAGVAGGLMVYFHRFVTPEQFGLMVSVFFLLAVIVGGMGSTLGAILGTIFVTLIPEFLRVFLLFSGELLNVDTAKFLVPLRETIFGLLIVTFLIFEPRGLAHMWHRFHRKFFASAPR